MASENGVPADSGSTKRHSLDVRRVIITGMSQLDSFLTSSKEKKGTRGWQCVSFNSTLAPSGRKDIKFPGRSPLGQINVTVAKHYWLPDIADTLETVISFVGKSQPGIFNGMSFTTSNVFEKKKYFDIPFQ